MKLQKKIKLKMESCATGTLYWSSSFIIWFLIHQSTCGGGNIRLGNEWLSHNNPIQDSGFGPKLRTLMTILGGPSKGKLLAPLHYHSTG